MAITEEQVMKVLGRSPAVKKPNVREIVAQLIGEVNSQSINDKTRIRKVVERVVRDLVSNEDCMVMGSSMRSALNPPISYSLSGRSFGQNNRTSHRGTPTE